MISFAGGQSNELDTDKLPEAWEAGKQEQGKVVAESRCRQANQMRRLDVHGGQGKKAVDGDGIEK